MNTLTSWLLPLSITILKFIRSAACINNSFFFNCWIPLWTPVNRHLFPMNISFYGHMCFHFWENANSGLIRSFNKFIHHFEKTPKLVSKVLLPFYIPPSQDGSTSSLIMVCSFDCCYSNEYTMMFHCALTLQVLSGWWW